MTPQSKEDTRIRRAVSFAAMTRAFRFLPGSDNPGVARSAMKTTMSALRMSIFVNSDDIWHHKPLFHEIVNRAKTAGLNGASVLRGVEGFGASSLIHTTRLLSLAEDLPVEIVVVDAPERIRSFLPQLDGLITEGMVTIEEVEVTRYAREGAAVASPS